MIEGRRRSPNRSSRARAFAWVAIAYVVALAVAGLVLELLAAQTPLARVAAADAAATVVVFAFSVAFDNSSFYDPYWSVAPIAIVGWLALGPGAGHADLGRRILVTALVALWGTRLTWNWARGWSGLDHEDWRYVNLRRANGRAYWLVSFVGIHFFPTVLVFLGCVPLVSALVDAEAPLGPLDAVAAIVILGATALEAIADEQLRAFRLQKANDGKVCAVGLWAWSRHPNYLGEIGVWVGAALFGVAVAAPAWSVSGAVAMVALFVGISIPMIEKRAAERRQAWAEYRARTSMLLPWPPKRPG